MVVLMVEGERLFDNLVQAHIFRRGYLTQQGIGFTTELDVELVYPIGMMPGL